MLARSDAIGVRSSWLASATSWRCACAERSSASSVALKLLASRASSSRPLTSTRCDVSRLPLTVSVRRVKRTIGVSAVRATSAPSSAAIAMPPTPTRMRISTIRLSSWSTSVSGRAISAAPSPPLPIVSTRRWVPRTVRSLSARPRPVVAIALSEALRAIAGEEPWPPGTATAPCGEMNCT